MISLVISSIVDFVTLMDFSIWQYKFLSIFLKICFGQFKMIIKFQFQRGKLIY